MLGYIYTITNNITNKIYIGQTIKPKERWQKHKQEAKNVDSLLYKSHLYNAMNKYGVDNFTFKIIEECDRDILDQRERYWIQKLNTLEPNGYNISNGGRKLFGSENPFYGKHHTDRTKQIISEKNTGRKATDKERRMRSQINKDERNPFYGKHHSNETKEKIKETSAKNGNYEKLSKRMKENNPNDGTAFHKPVAMMDTDFNVIDVFESHVKAGEYVKSLNLSSAKFPSNSITDVCKGRCKTAFGFNWCDIVPTLQNNFNENTNGYIVKK